MSRALKMLALATPYAKQLCENVFLGLVLCISAFPQQRPTSIDLTRFGFPPATSASNPKSCTVPYRGYHWVQWLDNQHLVVVFNTTPMCPRGAKDAFVSGNARVLVLTGTGELVAQKDIPYVADLWQSETPGRGLAIGPGGAILVIVHGVPWAAVPNADGNVWVFTQDLQLVQSIQTETASTTMGYKKFTHFGLHFEGVVNDRKAVVFSEDTGIGKPQKCLLFAELPLKQVATCGPNVISKQRENFDVEAPYRISENETATAFLGRSTDQSRSTVFVVKDRPLCNLAGAFCPGKGTLVVYETQTKRPLFRRRYPLDAALAFSPDGLKIASFLHNRLETISIQ
jgi:hypothetical protein